MQKAIFIDRDGVINKKMPDGDYVKSWEEFEFIPGTIEALRRLAEAGYALFVVTNQRGIARGLMTHAHLERIHANMRTELARHGVYLAGIYYCPHDYDDNCDCRKPKPGLLLRAAKENNLNLSDAILIGDSEKDIQAGSAAGCKTILLGGGKDLAGVVGTLL